MYVISNWDLHDSGPWILQALVLKRVQLDCILQSQYKSAPQEAAVQLMI